MMEKITITFPHCDPRVVHEPGTCDVCHESGLQYVREIWGIAYTGKPVVGLIGCPAEARRSLENIERWPHNRPDKA